MSRSLLSFQQLTSLLISVYASLVGCPDVPNATPATTTAQETEQGHSILQYVTTSFFGGAYVDLSAIEKDPTFQLLPLDLFSRTLGFNAEPSCAVGQCEN